MALRYYGPPTSLGNNIVARHTAFAFFGLAMFGMAAAAHSQDCFAVAGNKTGDLINVTVLLQTDDPDENGEGEPVDVSSSGGEFTGRVGVYFSAQPFSYVATQPNETVTGTLTDSDGDETCSITVSWNQRQ